MGVTKGPLEELIEKAGGCAVIDGGFATQLEALGADINDPLWSALCLISNPHLIKKVHMQYLEAGADVLITSSYQATIPGFLSKGLSIEEAEKLLQKSVKLAIEARDNFWTHLQKNPKDGYNRALLAASIGSYGAYLADGSEYSGVYGPDIELDKLKDFHRRRLQVLASAEPDLLAFEAIPNKLEAQAIVELLNEEKVNIPSWICFSSVDGKHTPSGHSFKECLEILNCCERVPAIGVNCTSPHFIDKLIHELRKVYMIGAIKQTIKLIAGISDRGQSNVVPTYRYMELLTMVILILGYFFLVQNWNQFILVSNHKKFNRARCVMVCSKALLQ
ncbi:Homocysteine S-methyltransferase family protein [Rhynchospora pubera]|uniref:homocysteine S-methyltransferase n=1 Tax=Rhynchospora pubera TaxID=906938 RepID=A0AAV8HXV5_9POAL|nr:Homocysteine S-methyltransferase family protein [Rhynchospora pubera]